MVWFDTTSLLADYQLSKKITVLTDSFASWLVAHFLTRRLIWLIAIYLIGWTVICPLCGFSRLMNCASHISCHKGCILNLSCISPSGLRNKTFVVPCHCYGMFKFFSQVFQSWGGGGGIVYSILSAFSKQLVTLKLDTSVICFLLSRGNNFFPEI